MEFRSWRRQLNEGDQVTVGACLRAAAEGPFFPEWEFHTLFGLHRDEVRAFAASWPNSKDERDEFQAVNNSMNNLLGYPHGLEAQWSSWIPVDRGDLEVLYASIREASGGNDETRAFLVRELARLEGLTDHDLEAKARLVQDVVSAARRLGVAVPTRLVG